MTAQETLIDYRPTQEEEITRLKKKAADNTARIEMLMSDPTIAEFQRAAKNFDKKMKEIEKLRSENNKIDSQIAEIFRVVLDEPTEDGYYIFSKTETNRRWKHGSNREVIRTDKALFLKAMGYWFDLSGGNSTAPSNEGYLSTDSFEELIGLDNDTIEATITKLEEVSVYPAELLKTVESDPEPSDEAINNDDETIEDDE